MYISDKEKKSVSLIHFQRLVQFLAGHSIISHTIGDKSFQEYSEQLSTGEEIGKDSKFDTKAKRFDDFFFKKFDMDKKYQNLAIIFQLFWF